MKTYIHFIKEQKKLFYNLHIYIYIYVCVCVCVCVCERMCSSRLPDNT